MPSTQEIAEFGRIASPQQCLAAAVAAFLAMAIVVFLYGRDARGLPSGLSILLVGLRLGAVALIGWIALDPRIVVESTVVHPPRLAVLLDHSQSMTTVDADGASSTNGVVTRWAQLLEVLNRQSTLAEWRRGREVELFLFGKDIRPFADLTKAGDGAFDDETRLGGALIDLCEAKSKRPPAALILATDGALNSGPGLDEALAAVKAARVPVFPIPFGSERPRENLRVVDVRMPARVFRGADDAGGTATVEATGGVEGAFEVVLEAKRLDGPASTIALGKKTVALSAGQPSAVVPIAFPPREAGRWEVSARMDVRPGELRTDDNRAAAAVVVVDRKTRVLLIAASSTREYQFLRSVLFRDKSVELSLWLQPGRPGVSQDAQRVLEKFPADRADLFAYDVVVAIDPDWRLIDDVAQQNLSDWVSAQAGGLILVAGSTYWTKLAPESPVVAVSPVVPRRSVLEAANAPAAELRPLSFTQEGERAKSFALADDPAVSRKLWDQFAGVFWAAPVERLKPGATLLASAVDGATVGSSANYSPFIATQFFGAGRVIYLGSGEFWRLRPIDERLYERLWTQFIRYAGEGRLLRGAQRGGFQIDEREVPAGSDLPLKAFVLDEQFRPLRTEKLITSATTTSGIVEVALEPVVAQPGRYQGVLSAPPPGPLKVQLSLPGGGVVEESFSIRASRLESDDVRVRRDVLDRIAAASGGRVVLPADVDQLAGLLPTSSETTVLTSPPKPRWDRAWVVCLLTGLLATEWIVRKWRRLP